MGIKDQAKRFAASAGVAIATTGLSNCNDNGAVDPAPPPLQCNTVNTGQTLTASATRSADTVDVTIRNTHAFSTWRVDRVVIVSGATIASTRVPGPGSTDPLGIVLQLNSPTTTLVTFTVEATLFGPAADTCSVQRTFNATISPAGVQVSLADADRLPLAARQRAEIVLANQAENVVELHARTLYQGASDVSWSVTEGELDIQTGPVVRWALPRVPGIYQVELVIDFGDDGLAFDMMLLEVG
jgi:hypothetical protein